MTNPYYTYSTGTPIAQSRGSSQLVRNEFTLLSTAFDAANVTLLLKATIASPTFTGVPAAPTAAPGLSTTQLATTEFVTTADNLKAPIASPTFTGTVTIPSGASIAGFAPLASPALTGVPTAPTATTGTNTTQLATTQFVISQGLSSALPGQSGNAGRFVTTDGTNASWATPDLVAAKDTRSVSEDPFAYPGASLHFKNTGTDSLSDGGSHYAQLKLNPYSDFSGQNSHELAFTVNNNLWHRNATGATTWGSWYKLLSTANFVAGTNYQTPLAFSAF